MNYLYLLLAGALVASAQTNRRVIIKLKDTAAASNVSSFVQSHLDAQASSALESALPQDSIDQHFNSTAFVGFSGSFSTAFLDQLAQQHNDTIDYVEEDHPIQAYVEQRRAPWGLARISAADSGSKAAYKFPSSAGKGVEVFVIDSGLEASHPDFEGRAKMVANFVKGEDGADYSGHGTHIAGTIAGKTFGVAKKANVYGIKVLDKSGKGYDSQIIGAITHVINNKKKGVKTVINMSLGGRKSRSLDDAVTAAVEHGVVVVVAAGNEHSDACGLSPSGAKDAIAVGAVDQQDRVAKFSNFGSCVSLYAPGVGIPSTSNSKGKGVRILSGTSMASPHVAGIAALLMGEKDYSSARQVIQEIKKSAVPFAKASNHALLMASVRSEEHVSAPQSEEPETDLPSPVRGGPRTSVPETGDEDENDDDEEQEQPAPKPRKRQDPQPAKKEPVADDVGDEAPSQEDGPQEDAPAPQEDAPSQDDAQPDESDAPAGKPIVMPGEHGSGWMVTRPKPGNTAAKKPCDNERAPPKETPEQDEPSKGSPPVPEPVPEANTPAADNSTATVPPATDNSTTTAPSVSDNSTTTVPPASDNSTATLPPVTDNSTTTLPPATDNSTVATPPTVDNSTATMPPATDNSTVALPPVADNSTTAVPPVVDNSTATVPPASDNSTVALPPVTDNSTTTVPPASDNSTVAVPPANDTTSDVDQKCTDGAFQCRKKGFVKCDHGKWVSFQCAPGTECQQTSADVIICNYPTSPKKDCDDKPKDTAPLPSNNATIGNDTTTATPQPQPLFEIPSNATVPSANVTVPSNATETAPSAPNVPSSPSTPPATVAAPSLEAAPTQPAENAKPIAGEPASETPSVAQANPWDVPESVKPPTHV